MHYYICKKFWSRKQDRLLQGMAESVFARHEHQQTPTIFYLKLWTFALLFFYLDMEFLGLFGVFVDF